VGQSYNAMIGLLGHFYYFLAFFCCLFLRLKFILFLHFSIETAPNCTTTTLDFGFSQGRIASEL